VRSRVRKRVRREVMQCQRDYGLAWYVPPPLSSLLPPTTNTFLLCNQIKMSKPGTTILPSAGSKEIKLLRVKYEIFKESVGIQRRWRESVREALGE
jgi:hypothetical protein